MFTIPWRLVAGVLLGAVIVKESRRVSNYYDSARSAAIDALQKARDSCKAASCRTAVETTTCDAKRVSHSQAAVVDSKEN